MNVWEEQREESFGRDGATVTRTFRVEPYAQRLALVEALLGGIELVSGQLVRILPNQDPWMPWLWCQDAKCVPVELIDSPGSAAGLAMLAIANYSESARVVATYKTLAPETAAGLSQGQQGPGNESTEKELATFQFDFSAQQLTLPNQYWKWAGGDTLLAQTNTGLTKTFPRVDFLLVRHFCHNLPFTAMTQLAGRVNHDLFVTRGFGWPPETLRFEGGSSSQKVTNTGVPFLDISYKFAVMPVYDGTADDTAAAVVNVARTSNVVTLTTSAAHGFSAGNTVVVAGLSGSGSTLNGTYTITAATSTTFSYALAGADIASALDDGTATSGGVPILQYVGWNRLYRAESSRWERPVATGDASRRVYQSAENIVQTLGGRVVTGFDLLFHPQAT